LIVGFGVNWLSLLGCLVRAEARLKVNIYLKLTKPSSLISCGRHALRVRQSVLQGTLRRGNSPKHAGAYVSRTQ
jgi:hypothetical protein